MNFRMLARGLCDCELEATLLFNSSSVLCFPKECLLAGGQDQVQGSECDTEGCPRLVFQPRFLPRCPPSPSTHWPFLSSVLFFFFTSFPLHDTSAPSLLALCSHSHSTRRILLWEWNDHSNFRGHYFSSLNYF